MDVNRAVRALRNRRFLVVALPALLLASAFVIPTALNAAPPPWTIVWDEEFSGPTGSRVDPSRWTYDVGHGPPGAYGWGNNELQAYTTDPANVALDGYGHLRITATRDAAGAWRSGRIQSVRSDFRPPTGGSLKIEARIQAPNGGDGYWPAFWSLGAPFRTDRRWPSSGEIDVMENVDGSPTVHGTLHCGVSPGGPCNEPVGRTGTTDLPGPSGTAGYHVYSVVWNDATDDLTWYLDDRTYARVDRVAIGAAWDATLDHGYFLLLNLAVGGALSKGTSGSTRPGGSMMVDWVHLATRTGA